MQEGVCAGCGDAAVETSECDCTGKIYACDTCRATGQETRLRCGAFRAYACLDFVGTEAGVSMDSGTSLPVGSVIGAWGPPKG